MTDEPEFEVFTILFSTAEHQRLLQTARQLGYHVCPSPERPKNQMIVGIKPQSEDAEALFDLAGIEI